MNTRECTYFALGTAAPPHNWWAVAIEAMMSETANVNCLLMADTAAAAAAEVEVRHVRTSLAAVRRLGVVRPRERDLQEVTLRR